MRNSTRRVLVQEAEALEQVLYVTGDIETRAGGQQTAYATEPIVLKIVSGKQQLSQK